MRKVVKWMKKWSLLLFVVLIGIGYMTFFDHWQTYAASLDSLKMTFEKYIASATPSVPGADGVAAGDDSKAEDSVGTEDSFESEGGSGAGKDSAAEDGLVAEDGSVSGGDSVTEDGVAAGDGSIAGEGSVPGEPVYAAVDDSYFTDALFIGDSRTVGLYEYAEWEDVATFYASTGLTVYKMFDTPIVEVPGQRQKETVEQALAQKQFAKIYLMIGINEMGTGTVDSFMEAYEKAVRHLQELQPDAIIYLQGIMKVTAERSARGDYITNEGIQERNDRIEQLADNKKIFYLDVNPLVCDESGGMNPEETFDGVHLKAQYISIWKEFLKSHAIE